MYEIRIYLRGAPGYFSYAVEHRDQAMMHLAEITRGGYRRYDPGRGRFTWYAPERLWEINVIGSGLESDYPDAFHRT